jgi:hypothetical protein
MILHFNKNFCYDAALLQPPALTGGHNNGLAWARGREKLR